MFFSMWIYLFPTFPRLGRSLFWFVCVFAAPSCVLAELFKDSRPAFVISSFLAGGFWTSPLLWITFEQVLYFSALDIFCSKAKIYSRKSLGCWQWTSRWQLFQTGGQQVWSGLSEDVHPFKYRELQKFRWAPTSSWLSFRSWDFVLCCATAS